MRITGIHCTVDKMGRIVLPAQVRQMLGFGREELVEFFLDKQESRISLQRVVTGCIFCSEVEGLRRYKGRDVCKECVARLSARIASGGWAVTSQAEDR